ncbi:MAG: hypothetical protein QW416_03930 [Candidatus Nitrosocaldaceae archaeon]
MNDLLSYIKEYKAAVIVLKDMTSLSYGIRQEDKSTKDITDIGVLGVAFRRSGNTLQYIKWKRENNGSYKYEEQIDRDNRYCNMLLHHSFGIKKLSDVI